VLPCPPQHVIVPASTKQSWIPLPLHEQSCSRAHCQVARYPCLAAISQRTQVSKGTSVSPPTSTPRIARLSGLLGHTLRVSLQPRNEVRGGDERGANDMLWVTGTMERGKKRRRKRSRREEAARSEEGKAGKGKEKRISIERGDICSHRLWASRQVPMLSVEYCSPTQSLSKSHGQPCPRVHCHTATVKAAAKAAATSQGLVHSSTSQLNLSRA